MRGAAIPFPSLFWYRSQEAAMIQIWIALSILSVVTLGAGLWLVNDGNLGLGLIGAAIVIAILARIEQAARYRSRRD